MSQAPYAVRNIRNGTRFGVDLKLEDTLSAGLVDSYPEKTPMGITAENLGKKYGITRKDVDQFALESQKRYGHAYADGRFKNEITPVTLKGKKGPELFEVDEHPRPNATIEGLNKLAPVFVKETGLVTAGYGY